MLEWLEQYRAWAPTVNLTFSQGAVVYTFGVTVGHAINRNYKMAALGMCLVLILIVTTTTPQMWGYPA